MKKRNGKNLLILAACIFALSFSGNSSFAKETLSTINSKNLQEVKVKGIVVKFDDALVSEDLKFVLKDEKGNAIELSSKNGLLDSFTAFEGKKYTIKLKENEKYKCEIDFVVKKYNGKYYAEIGGKQDLVLKLEKKEVNSDKSISQILVKSNNKLVSDSLNFFVVDKNGNSQKVTLNNGKFNNLKVIANEKYTLKLESNEKYTMSDLQFVVRVDNKGKFYAYTLDNKLIEEITLKEKGTTNIADKGWMQDSNTKQWKYLKADGSLLKGWLNDNSYSGWYYFDSNGIMQIGWTKDSTGNWYYLDSSGKMQTGWYYDDYYEAWFNLGKYGTMQTGWVYSDETWYYLDSSGKMQTGWIYDYNINSYFYLSNSGAMQTGWVYDKEWYYLNSNGTWNKSGISYADWYVLDGYFQTNSGYQRKYVGSDYIVVSLSNQKLWIVKDEELYFTTGVISGKNSTPTPVGAYKIQGKQTDRFLKGDDYNLHVDYWIPFNGDYGIHDASWQKSYYNFENPIYQKNRGSHGCLNIFPKYMSTIYDSTYVGMPVIITD